MAQPLSRDVDKAGTSNDTELEKIEAAGTASLSTSRSTSRDVDKAGTV